MARRKNLRFIEDDFYVDFFKEEWTLPPIFHVKGVLFHRETGKIVGTGYLYYFPKKEYKPCLKALYVTPTLRENGLADLMLTAFENYVRDVMGQKNIRAAVVHRSFIEDWVKSRGYKYFSGKDKHERWYNKEL